MNLIDYSNISIITHIRVDGDDRLENLHIRNEVFHKYCKNLEFVTVEDDVTRKTPKMDNTIYHLTENGGLYNKNKSYNIGFNMTDRPYVLFLDVDCIIDPNIIFNVVNRAEGILEKSFVYPFEYVLYLKEQYKQEFKRHKTIESLILQTREIEKTHDNNSKFGRLFTGSCGGAILASRHMFERFNGFNPNFEGWGFEDSEFRDRIIKLGKPPVRIKNVMLYHLPHGDHFTNRNVQTIKAVNNKKIYESVLKMSEYECWEYIKTWKL